MGTRTLGPYEILGEIGRGGMGTVLEARHIPTGARRAVKLLEGSDPEGFARFRREAAALARVGGAGVVAVHDSGHEGGRAWFAMDLMPGGSLEGRLRGQTRLDWREGAAITAKLARTLARCHALGLIHRDVKPDNVLFDARGEPHLADFGCVRDLGASALTRTGAQPGTTSYMAPEQLDGRSAGPSADIYALGVLLHELVTGEKPYAGTFVQLIAAAREGKRRRASELVGSPPGLDLILDAALAPQPADRPEAADLARSLEDLVSGKTTPVRRSRRAPGLAAAGVVALGLLGVWAAPHRPGGAAARQPPPVAGIASATPTAPPRATGGADAAQLEKAAKAVRQLVEELTLVASRSSARPNAGLGVVVGEALARLEEKAPGSSRALQRQIADAAWDLHDGVLRYSIDASAADGCDPVLEDATKGVAPLDPELAGALLALRLDRASEPRRADRARFEKLADLARAVRDEDPLRAGVLADIACRYWPHGSTEPALGAWEAEIQTTLDALARSRSRGPDDDARRKEVRYSLLRDSASNAERPIREATGPDRVKKLGEAIARRQQALDAATGAESVLESVALARLRFQAVRALPPRDPGIKEQLAAILELSLSASRHEAARAAVLFIEGDGAAALELATGLESASDPAARKDAIALHALIAIESGKPDVARELLKAIVAHDTDEYLFTFAYSLGELRDLCKGPP
jgi:hypothetical protein